MFLSCFIFVFFFLYNASCSTMKIYVFFHLLRYRSGFASSVFMFGNNFIASDFRLVLCWIFPLNSFCVWFCICACMRNSSIRFNGLNMFIDRCRFTARPEQFYYIHQQRPPIIIIVQLKPYFIVCILWSVVIFITVPHCIYSYILKFSHFFIPLAFDGHKLCVLIVIE